MCRRNSRPRRCAARTPVRCVEIQWLPAPGRSDGRFPPSRRSQPEAIASSVSACSRLLMAGAGARCSAASSKECMHSICSSVLVRWLKRRLSSCKRSRLPRNCELARAAAAPRIVQLVHQSRCQRAPAPPSSRTAATRRLRFSHSGLLIRDSSLCIARSIRLHDPKDSPAC